MKGKSYLPGALPPGSEVVLATAAATLFSVYYGYEGGVVGEIPSAESDAGLSFFDGMIKIPIEVVDIKGLLNVPIAERCFDGSMVKLFITAAIFSAINFLSIVGIASGFESDNNVPWSAPRELISQGVSNIAAGAVGSAPVSGSMSRSLVSRMTSASSKLACIITALLWIYMMPYMSVMSPTPKAALSSVIVSAVVKNVVMPKKLFALKGTDFIVGVGTAATTAITSPTLGFGAGMVMYILITVLTGKDSKKKVA
jgi:MFS superfamily sulfate permease-like transporter